MDNLQITCDRVDREDLDTRYLAGSLNEELAEAFEAHYFGCDRCWALVHQGVEVRSAGPLPSVVKSVPKKPARLARWAWTPLAAAAAILVVWVGTREGRVTPDEEAGGGGMTLRGTADSLSVSAASARGVLTATWTSVTNASNYQVRLFTANGDVLWDRRVNDTTLTMARDSIPGASTGALFWQVQALDLAGATLTRSTLIEVPPDAAVR